MPKNNHEKESLKAMEPFGDLTLKYIEYKRAQGYKIGLPAVCCLKRMNLFFRQMGVTDVLITREMYDEWTRPKPSENMSNVEHRRSAIRGFSKYLITLGYENIYTGYDDARILRQEFIPYIFSREEIGRMFQTLSDLCQESPGYENDTFRMAITMYYCCGLRKSELLNLAMENINFETGKIAILDGKNGVSRNIVVSDSLLREMRAYQEKYRKAPVPGELFLHGPKSKRYADCILYRKYHQLLSDAGIAPRTDGHRQRIHDLRHTFCVRTLEQMQEKGFDLYTSLPLLSVYLGHKYITETEYYLRMVNEHFDGILQASASYSPGLFPKIDGEDADEE